MLTGEDIRPVLDAWDRGQPILTAEMGGIGEAYEIKIHRIAMEMIRYMLSAPFDFMGDQEHMRARWEEYVEDMGDNCLALQVEVKNCTGAQYGAALNIAAVYMRNGYQAGLAMLPQERIISVQKKDVD